MMRMRSADPRVTGWDASFGTMMPRLPVILTAYLPPYSVPPSARIAAYCAARSSALMETSWDFRALTSARLTLRSARSCALREVRRSE